MKTQTTLFFCCLSMATLLNAQTTREHDSHAHGVGNLNVVLEGDELAIELISPAANIVGFEHAPSTDEQQAAVHQAEETFEQADTLFVLSEQAGCRVEHVHVESELLEGHEDEHAHEEHEDEHAHEEHEDEHAHEEHDHDEEHHDEKHAHEDHADEHHEDEHAHDKHDEEHAHEHDHDEEVHSEFHVEYEFHCDNVENLTEIQVNLFETFPGTETLNVQLLTPDQQTAVSLDKDNITIEL